jgi:hypothetical protein
MWKACGDRWKSPFSGSIQAFFGLDPGVFQGLFFKMRPVLPSFSRPFVRRFKGFPVFPQNPADLCEAFPAISGFSPVFLRFFSGFSPVFLRFISGFSVTPGFCESSSGFQQFFKSLQSRPPFGAAEIPEKIRESRACPGPGAARCSDRRAQEV